MMQVFAAHRAAVSNLEEFAEQLALAAVRATAEQAALHGGREIALGFGLLGCAHRDLRRLPRLNGLRPRSGRSRRRCGEEADFMLRPSARISKRNAPATGAASTSRTVARSPSR